MCKTQLEVLEVLMEKAIEDENIFIVAISMPDQEKPELIVNEPSSLKSKLEYYKKAYNDDLELKYFNKIKIVAFFAIDKDKQKENYLTDLFKSL